ncbi:hypothetical protein INT45_007305 [Circinella minor]|uniref:Protein YOP1 n=1 Tax=Circinella minor TaxID=1195481 RepID=A0A8H7RZM6_9FUNG|nr:hypothetical protein INT45_007305 [Circinella minor]
MYFILKLFMLQLYPAYTCFKVIKANDHTQYLPLLMYWVTAMSFIVCEHFADWLLFWIPFYNEVKILIVLWITLPQTKGAIVVYADFIEPILKKHENRIDKAFIEIQEKGKQMASVYGKQLLQIVNKLLADLFNKGREMITDEGNDSSITASSSTTVPTQQKSGPDLDGWGYTIYSSLISRGTQLSASLQASAQNRLNNQLQQQEEAQINNINTASTVSTTTTTKEEEKEKLERSDSYDSLGSFVASKKAPSSTGSNTGTIIIEGKSSQDQQQQQTWGNYLGGWIWSSGATNISTTPNNNNQDSKKDR